MKMILIRVFTITGILGLILLTGCGGGSGSAGKNPSPPAINPPPPAINPPPPAINPPPGSGAGYNMALAVTDTPPAGVTLLALSVTLTGAVLQPGNISVIANSQQLEFKSLEAESALVGTFNVPTGNYDSLTTMFSNPKLTFLNNSGAAIGSCLNGAICELDPSLSTSSVMLSGAPFPVNVAKNSVTELVMDLDLNNSISSSLSIIPTLKATSRQFTGGVNDPPADAFRNLFGKVTSIVRNFIQGPTFFPESPLLITLATESDSFSFNITDRTTYQGFGTNCQARISESCFAVGQVWEVDVSVQGGRLLGMRAQLKPQGQKELKVLVVVPNGPDQFEAVVLQEQPDVTGLELADHIHVHLLPGATFGLGGDLLNTAGFLFASASDLLDGQVVDIRLASDPSGTPLTVDADRVLLRTGSLTAQVKTKLDADNFLIDKLPGNFTSGQIHVETSSTTVFDNVSNVAALNVGDTVSLGGLLFKTASDPVVLAAKIRKR